MYAHVGTRQPDLHIPSFCEWRTSVLDRLFDVSKTTRFALSIVIFTIFSSEGTKRFWLIQLLYLGAA